MPPSELESDRIQVFIKDNKTYLSISGMQPDDAGTWQSLASSTAGTATFRTKLDLEGRQCTNSGFVYKFT